jgi:hypothetical protein
LTNPRAARIMAANEGKIVLRLADIHQIDRREKET